MLIFAVKHPLKVKQIKFLQEASYDMNMNCDIKANVRD